jgi:hypothetical protein
MSRRTTAKIKQREAELAAAKQPTPKPTYPQEVEAAEQAEKPVAKPRAAKKK